MKKFMIFAALFCFVGTALFAQGSGKFVIRNNATVAPGNALKARVDYKVVRKKQKVFPDKNAASGYTRMDEFEMKRGDVKEFNIKLGKDESIEGPVLLTIRCKEMISGPWKDKVKKEYTLTASGLDLTITGYVRINGDIKVEETSSSSSGGGSSATSSSNKSNSSTSTGNSSSSASSSPEHAKSINEAIKKSERKKTLQTVQTVQENVSPYLISGNMAYWLKKTPHDIKNENTAMDDIVADNVSGIYPGAIVYADQDLADGHPRPVALSPGKVTLWVNYHVSNSARSSIHNVPNVASDVHDSIHVLLSRSKNKPPVELGSKTFYVSSKNELAVNLGVDANFLKTEVKVKTDISSSQSTVTEAEDWTQKYYTVAINFESDRSKYFGSDVTPQMIEEAAQEAPLAIITSVTYGRRAYKFKDVSSSNFRFQGDESVKSYGQSVSSTQDIVKNAKDSSTWVWISGGDEGSAGEILKGSSIRNSVQKALSFDPNTNQGVPVSYTVQYLGSGSQIKVQPTGSYTTVEYVPMPHIVSCTFRNNCTHIAGAAFKIRVDYKVVKFVGDKKVDAERKSFHNGKETIWPMEGYNRVYEYFSDFGTERTFSLDLGKDEYLDDNIHLETRGRHTSSGKWQPGVEGYIYPDAKGKIDVDLHGHYGPTNKKNAYIYSKSHTHLVTDK